jgi:hypothetical protein
MEVVKPRVAVIMSVYKNDEIIFLKKAVESIINQTYKNFDLFIYRDGIVSNTLEELLEYFELKYSKVNIIRSDVNGGLASGLNHLIDLVLEHKNYKYVARMDSDDISRPKRFESQVTYLHENHELDVCGSYCREFGSSFALEEKQLPTTHKDLLPFSIVRCPFIHPTVMFNIKVFSDGNRYPTNTALTEDMSLWLDLLYKGYIFENINEVLLDYRLTEDTLNRRLGWLKALSEVFIRVKYMYRLNQFSFKNTLLILSRIIFHFLPVSIAKYIYKNTR